MLTTTRELIDYLKLDKSIREYTIIHSLVYSVIKCGNKIDADAIFAQYLIAPFESDYSLLLPVFKKFGDRAYAEQLFNLSVEQNKLNRNADPEILEVLGALQYDLVRPILADYAFANPESGYYLSKSAALGLLNFDCAEYQSNIEAEIEKCYGKNLFPEFIPALVCKLKNRSSILEKLYELGTEYASTDCNAGIILGFSLCGAEGRVYFKRALFDPNWETYAGGTGTTYYSYKGLINLGITFRELYTDIKAISEKERLAYCLIVFFALLKKKIDDFKSNDEERFSDIYLLLFKWKNDNESDNLIDLAQKVDKMDEAYEIQKLLEMKMNEEAILRNISSSIG